MRAPIWLTVASLSFASIGCGDPIGPDEDEDARFQVVMPGKADDYFSNVASEFEVTGKVTVEMTDDEFADERLRDKLVAERISAVGVYLATYLTDKFRGIDINDDGEITDDEVFFHNEEYGNFKAMVRNRSVDVLGVEGADGTYEASFTLDLAGPRDLPEQLVEAGGERANGVGVRFDLRMPRGATTDSGGKPIRKFNPDKYEGELESVRLTLAALPEVGDAFPAYADFFGDGRYDITLYYGHDYNVVRSDLKDARLAFDTLVSLGFTPPVEKFEDLGADSGPFHKVVYTVRQDDGEACVTNEAINAFNDPSLTVETLREYGVRSDAARNVLDWRTGEDHKPGTLDDRKFSTLGDIDSVRGIGPATMTRIQDAVRGICDSPIRGARVEVRVFHSDMYLGKRAEQRERVLYELVERDVFFYNGHAGPYYGLYLDGDYEAYVDDSEFADLPFEPGRQHLFVAQGCQTYSQYADMLYANPSLSEENLDVITTVNYSYAQGTMNLFGRLVATEAGSPLHRPASYNELIAGLNGEYWNAEKSVFYGVMGIDDNPSLHPFATPSTIGDECATHDECGAATSGSYCSGFSDGINRCVARTAAPDGCPEDTSYAYLADGQTVIGGVCWQMD